MDKAWTSRLARNGKTAFHPSWDGVLASLAIAALVAALALAAQCRSVAHVHRSCRKACRRAPARRRAPESLQEHRARLNTVRCQSPRRRVCLRESSCEGKRQHTFLRALMLSLYGTLLVHTSRVCSVVNVNGDDGGSIKPEPHDVVLSTANALHLLASSS